MDKFPNNVTPESSNIDSMIEKFHTEMNKSGEDLKDTRRLTVESPFRIDDEDSSHDVDQRLTDLESLIKRLQGEITDMSNNGGGSIENDNLLKLPSAKDKNHKEGKKDIYHLTVKDVMKRNNQCSNSQDKKSEDSHVSSNSRLNETFASIRRNFSLLWDEEEVFEDKTVVKKEK